MKRFLKINAADNVAVALADDLHEGETLDVEGVAVTLREDVARGHKFALRDIAAGENVVKYGYPIGHATQDVPQGGWIHTHNLKTNLRDDLEYTYAPKVYDVGCPKRDVRVMGYLRGNDTMGIRNELWIVPSVGCVNGQAQAIAERVKRECDCSHLDDVRVYTHNYGCSQLGDDHANTQRALAALVRHPNAGAVLVLGLGCENNQVSALKEVIGQWDDERMKFLVAQEVEDEIEAGFEICRGLVEKTKADKRQPLPLAYLKVGLKCGGSDGFSGITANPLVGLFSDWLIAQGGTTVLTEVPEMFGAETILMDRAADRRVFDGTVSLINDFKRYFRRFDQPIYENPSPGNKKGGITTLEEKSLGCVQKGGAQPVVDVLIYAQPVTKPGIEPLAGSGQRPGGRFGAGSLGLPAGALHHGTRHAFRVVRAHDEDFDQHAARGVQGQLDRLQRRHAGRGRGAAGRAGAFHRQGAGHGRRRASQARGDGFQGDRYLQDGGDVVACNCVHRTYDEIRCNHNDPSPFLVRRLGRDGLYRRLQRRRGFPDHSGVFRRPAVEACGVAHGADYARRLSREGDARRL